MALNKYKKPRDRKLAREYQRVQDLVERSSKISFKILHETRSSKLPDKYEITYQLRSIVSINDDKSPNYGRQHKLQITLPPNWPAADSPPDYYMQTEIWHPNIKSTDPYKGHVCINSKAIAIHEGLDDLILRVGELLQWKNYLAEDKPPYPEDLTVAEWVREYAEPKGIVSLEKGIFVDDAEILDPMAERVVPVFEDVSEPTKLAGNESIIEIDLGDTGSSDAADDDVDIEIEI